MLNYLVCIFLIIRARACSSGWLFNVRAHSSWMSPLFRFFLVVFPKTDVSRGCSRWQPALLRSEHRLRSPSFIISWNILKAQRTQWRQRTFTLRILVEHHLNHSHHRSRHEPFIPSSLLNSGAPYAVERRTFQR